MISPRCTGAPRSLGSPRSVLVARRDLALGTTLGANDLRVISRYATAVPDNAVSSLDDAVGKIVAVPVVEGSVLQATHLTTTERDGLGGLVPVGYRAVRVRPEDGLHPPAGAVVDVIASLEVAIDQAAEAEVVARVRRGCSRSTTPTTRRQPVLPTAWALPSSSPRTRRAGSHLLRRTAS